MRGRWQKGAIVSDQKMVNLDFTIVLKTLSKFENSFSMPLNLGLHQYKVCYSAFYITSDRTELFQRHFSQTKCGAEAKFFYNAILWRFRSQLHNILRATAETVETSFLHTSKSQKGAGQYVFSVRFFDRRWTQELRLHLRLMHWGRRGDRGMADARDEWYMQ